MPVQSLRNGWAFVAFVATFQPPSQAVGAGANRPDGISIRTKDKQSTNGKLAVPVKIYESQFRTQAVKGLHPIHQNIPNITRQETPAG